ncbi:MAG: transglycosylase SLT domain-containing protein [Gemmatimonadaceae bacterium]|nr:transglycosylase SLT domain-containing protein [Gemmatimonadaceae bacterium]
MRRRSPSRALPRLLITVVLLVGASACRSAAPLTPVIATSPAPRPAAPSAPANTPRDTARLALDSMRLPNVDDISRAVAGMFGDSLLIAPGGARRDSASVDRAVEDADSDAPTWDIDVRSYETHSRVAHYVTLFTETGKSRFQQRLSRGTRYEGMIRGKLRAAGLPEDLYYLPLVESGYDPHAYSRAAAVGMWQFMSSTGRDVGLRIDWWIDERRDPVKSTDAAIRFLRDLQEQFGSLYLAAAAYNGGPGRVSRGLKQFADELEGTQGEDRFFALAEQSYLRAETKNYVPQIIAAALAAKSPTRFGLSVDTLTALAYDSVLTPAATPLAVVARGANSGAATIAELNPHILRGMTPPTATYWVRVPVGSAAATSAMLADLPASERAAFVGTTVRSKETLAALAGRTGVPARAISQFNPGLRVGRRGRLVAGQAVRVPTAATLTAFRDVPDPNIERYGGVTRGTAARSAPARMHIVRRGESLGRIARRYGVSVARLKSLNGLRRDRVYAGQALLVRSGSASSASRTAVSASRSRARAGAASASAKASRAASATRARGAAAGKSKSARAATAKSARTKSGAASAKSATSRAKSGKPAAKKTASTSRSAKKKG